MLLDGSAGGPSEQTAIPNLTLRKKSFKIIDDLRKRIQAECGQVVSCSDITAIAARDSVVLVRPIVLSFYRELSLLITKLDSCVSTCFLRIHLINLQSCIRLD